jgi:hypothetical protein
MDKAESMRTPDQLKEAFGYVYSRYVEGKADFDYLNS